VTPRAIAQITTEEEEALALDRLHVIAQEAKITAQREYVRTLEARGQDIALVALEKENLNEMIKPQNLYST
jgi:hypothetical protein